MAAGVKHRGSEGDGKGGGPGRLHGCQTSRLQCSAARAAHLQARGRLHHVARHARQRLRQLPAVLRHHRRQLLLWPRKQLGQGRGRQRLHAAAQHAARHGARARPQMVHRLRLGAQAQAGAVGLRRGRQAFRKRMLQHCR